MTTLPAQAQEIDEKNRMRGHLEKIEKFYAEARAAGPMAEGEEGAALAALAVAHAFLNDEIQMAKNLARIRVTENRGALGQAYVQLFAARLAAGDMAGVEALLAREEEVLAVINKPAPADVHETMPDDSLAALAVQMKVDMKKAQSKKWEDLSYIKNIYCPLIVETLAQREDPRLESDALQGCYTTVYKAAMRMRQGKIIEAYHLLKSRTRKIQRRAGRSYEMREEPLPYTYDSLHVFDDCRKEPARAEDIAYLAGLETSAPEEIMVILLELDATDAAYDYALSYPALWDIGGQGKATVHALFVRLVEQRADDKALKLATTTDMLEEKAGRCWSHCGYHGQPWWWAGVPNIAHPLAARADHFAFATMQKIKDPRARFLAWMTMYYAVPPDTADTFPNCSGNTRHCVLAEMTRMAETYQDVTERFPDPPPVRMFMHAVIGEFARVAGDQALAKRMTAEIRNPEAHAVPEGNFYHGKARTIGELAVEVSEILIRRWQGDVAAEKIYPPAARVSRKATVKTEPFFERRHPALHAAIGEMYRDMRRHSWRFYSAGMVRRYNGLAGDREKFGKRCILDYGLYPHAGWPENL